MKITFIKPNMGLVANRPYIDHGRMQPLTFAVLAGQLSSDIHVALFDDRMEKIPYDEPTDLVGINVEIYTARRAYEIADKYRKRGVKVVIGGYHPTLIPDESLPHCDALVIGEAENVFAELIEDARNGRLKHLYKSDNPAELKSLRTRWDIFDNKSYLPLTLTQFSRGCINSCNFCATGTIFKKNHSHRPPEEVVEELAALSTPFKSFFRPFVFFVDDNIIGNIDAAKKLFKLLIPLNIRWVGQASLNFANDEELLELMCKSGCQGLVVGFETTNQANLLQMEKNCNLEFSDYKPLLERIRNKGLMLWAAFLIGYDSDDEAHIKRTVDFALENKFCFAAFNILCPYPGTPLYQTFQDQGRLLYEKWWLHPDYRFGDAVFQPARMTPEALAQACFAARRRFNNPLNIFRRAFDAKTNFKDLWSISTFFGYNPLFRRELFKKQGMSLGYEKI